MKIGWIGFITILYLVSVSYSENPLEGKLTANLRFFFPQGWSFFTRNPKEEQFNIYTISKEGSVSLLSCRHTSRKNLFGLGRLPRSIGREMSIILKYIDGNTQFQWKDASGRITASKLSLDDVKTLTIPHKEKRLRHLKGGLFVIVKTEILPREWIRLNQQKYKPWKYVVFWID